MKKSSFIVLSCSFLGAVICILGIIAAFKWPEMINIPEHNPWVKVLIFVFTLAFSSFFVILGG